MDVFQSPAVIICPTDANIGTKNILKIVRKQPEKTQNLDNMSLFGQQYSHQKSTIFPQIRRQPLPVERQPPPFVKNLKNISFLYIPLHRISRMSVRKNR
jgi:hypothetical protein